ncbi:MAG TPA: VWA domain-containing protein [Bryobacteraceae bacterium]|jgi:Ca-activated chloride channel homolog|nr:VWA domain-containing protein [Bryobacteraceae bacterium]
MIRGRVVAWWVSAWVVASAVAVGQSKGPVIAKAEQPGEFTLRTTSRLVLLDVSVKDAAGGFVAGLSKDNFKVFENGKPQSITQFADADIPVTVGIVVDESGSMRPKRAEVITAALVFNEASNPMDETFVINFNERPRRGLPDDVLFTDKVQQLRMALWQGIPEGRTALYDAIEMALNQLDFGRRDKKTLVLISDGGDNHSTHTQQEVMQHVLTSEATIYTVGLYDEDDPEKNEGVLKKLAQVSGGVFYHPATLADIVPICRQIAKDIRTRYTVGYVPLPEGKAERHIKVEAASADHPKLVVRTRTTYLFGDQAAETR